jgi:hypothetical protein
MVLHEAQQRHPASAGVEVIPLRVLAGLPVVEEGA